MALVGVRIIHGGHTGANRALQGTEQPVEVTVQDMKPDDVVILVVGLTGSGKSTLIRSASGHESLSVGHTLKSCTRKVIAIRFWDTESARYVVLIDTPGFDNALEPDDGIWDMISEWLSASYKNNVLLSGVLYAHRITDKQMAGTPLKNFRTFQKLCGKSALEKVYLTTTMWDEVDSGVGERTLDYLKMNYWKAMIDQGAQIARCRTDDDSPKNLLRHILAQSATPEALLVQPIPVQEKERGKRRTRWRRRPVKGRTETLQVPPRVTRESPLTVDIEDLGPDDVVIAVLGPTGSGKSAFINAASGHDTQGIGYALKSFTSKIQAVKYQDPLTSRQVVLVDTPGLDHTFKSDSEILSMISAWLRSSYRKNILFSGVLYLHRITDNRMAGTPLKHLRLLQKLCGSDALKKVYLVTTMWDEVNSVVGEKRLNELKTDYWKAMIDRGAQIARSRIDDASSKELVRRVILQEGIRKSLLIQQEMVELQKEFRETAAGHQLFTQLEALAEKQMAVLRRIDEERRMALDANLLAELQAEYNALRAQIDDQLR